MKSRGFSVGIVAVLFSGCAHSPRSFRLIQTPGAAMLVPPKVRSSPAQQTAVRLSKAKPDCMPSGSGWRQSGKSLIVSRDSFAKATGDDLDRWVAILDAGCLPNAREALLNSVPLELASRRKLISSSDLTAFSSLRVVSPVLRYGSRPDDSQLIVGEPVGVTGKGGNLSVELKLNPEVIGYEVAWYDVRTRADGSGLRIVPRFAELHRGDTFDKVERTSVPRVNRFDFNPDVRWFRYFVMTRVTSERNDHNMVLLGAATHAELNSRSEAFRKDASDYLKLADPKSYAALSGAFGVNPYIRIRVNGEDRDISAGTTVGQVIGRVAIPTLTIQKPYAAHLAPVQWDHSRQDILNLPLEGGEELSWTPAGTAPSTGR